MSRQPLVWADFDDGPVPAGYVAPFVHPDECDHDGGPDDRCSQCCPCDMCGAERAKSLLYERETEEVAW